ncbi:MAG: hypothetical protein ACUVS7_04450 [Bryobacteraceae bacterium]
MKLSLPYLLYGLLVLGSGFTAGRMGWFSTSATEIKNVPKSIRENPGVYRSHYSWLPRWFGGK